MFTRADHKLCFFFKALTKKQSNRSFVLRTKTTQKVREIMPVQLATSSPKLLSFISNFYWLLKSKKILALVKST
jgi:hypothetical protein